MGNKAEQNITPATDTIDPDAQYAVHVSEPVGVLGECLYPGREYRLRGDALISIQAKVKDANQLR